MCWLGGIGVCVYIREQYFMVVCRRASCRVIYVHTASVSRLECLFNTTEVFRPESRIDLRWPCQVFFLVHALVYWAQVRRALQLWFGVNSELQHLPVQWFWKHYDPALVRPGKRKNTNPGNLKRFQDPCLFSSCEAEIHPSEERRPECLIVPIGYERDVVSPIRPRPQRLDSVLHSLPFQIHWQNHPMGFTYTVGVKWSIDSKC